MSYTCKNDVILLSIVSKNLQIYTHIFDCKISFLTQPMTLNRYKVIINKYDDHIVTCRSNEQLKDFLSIYDKIQNTSIKLKYPNNMYDTAKILFNPFDFQLIATFSDMYLYANEIARNKCPAVINNEINGSLTVVVVNNKYILLVKDKTKGNITNPCGTLNISETYEQCAIRETFEETGIQITDIIKCGTFDMDCWRYDTKFINNTTCFYTQINLSDEQISAQSSFSNDEIEKTYLIPIDEINTTSNEVVIDNYPVTHHHLLLMRFVINKIHKTPYSWINPSYLRNFKLYHIDDEQFYQSLIGVSSC